MTAPKQPIIKLEHVFAGYEEKVALQDVSLEVFDHDFLGVIGPNGGGKTTLMRVILGMMKPFSGKVSYFRNGVQVPELTIGYLPQYNDIDRQSPSPLKKWCCRDLVGKRNFSPVSMLVINNRWHKRSKSWVWKTSPNAPLAHSAADNCNVCCWHAPSFRAPKWWC